MFLILSARENQLNYIPALGHLNIWLVMHDYEIWNSFSVLQYINHLLEITQKGIVYINIL